MTHAPLTPEQQRRARVSRRLMEAERRRQAAEFRMRSREWFVDRTAELLVELVRQLVLAAIVMVALRMGHDNDPRIPALGFWPCLWLLIVARHVFGWRGARS